MPAFIDAIDAAIDLSHMLAFLKDFCSRILYGLYGDTGSYRNQVIFEGVDNGIQDLGILLPQAEKEQGATLLSHDLIKSRTGMATANLFSFMLW
ncbi:MAG: hypothetical protein U5L00_19955 [Desulfovermiculus sp.]|nr:hypothetical protein [Desulfovermiculus sp.]